MTQLIVNRILEWILAALLESLVTDVPRRGRRNGGGVWLASLALSASTSLPSKVAHGRTTQVVVAVGSNWICHQVVGGREERAEARRLSGVD